MRKQVRRWLAVLFFIMFMFSGCGSKRNASVNEIVPETIDMDFTSKETEKSEIDENIKDDLTGVGEEVENNIEDPQAEAVKENGAESDFNLGIESGISCGIDVSRYQGTIDWALVKQAGVEFAMVRVGYRTKESGEIVEDSNARYNLQEANKVGIPVGVYFFSSAVDEKEALEEADFTADVIAGYRISCPVVYNCEDYDNIGNRQNGLSKETRTTLAVAFLDRIESYGYTPMFYASVRELKDENDWETAILEKHAAIWIASYPAVIWSEKERPDYTGSYQIWQYTNRGSVAGIDGTVDLDVAWKVFTEVKESRGEAPLEEVGADVEANMRFSDVNETVTAKDATNLRNIPGQGEDSIVLHVLKNGETVTRTGVSDSGWSRVLYDGNVCYAVSNYLTTDLSYQPSAPIKEDDGIKTVFVERNESVTPKIEVNLRALPSVTNPDAVIVATVSAGTIFTRTGINEDYGWSRVEYEGQTLYCVSSYIQIAE